MKWEDDGFFVAVQKTHKFDWKVSLPHICCAIALVCFAQTVFGAGSGITTTIVDADGDIATVQLSGSGTMTVSLVNPSNGPIDHITLFNTDSSSSLTIKVKKSANGDGVIDVNTISGDGSLKSLSAKSVNIVGSGINLGGFVGALTIKNLGNSTLTLQGNGVSAGGIVLGRFSGGVVSNSQIQIGGSVGKFSATQMLNSQLWAGYTPAVSTNPMAGGTFSNGYQIISVMLKGTKGPVASTFVSSTIAAQSIGAVTLAGANTSGGGTPFGILADTGIKSVSVKQPKFKWNPNGRITQTLDDFQVRRLAEVIIGPHTRILTAVDLSGLVIDSNVYSFSTSAPSLQGVQVGDVLVSSGDDGFLVDVLSVTSGGGSLVLQTTPGSLTDAIQKGAFDQTIPFVPTTLLYLAPGVTVTTNNVAAAKLARASANPANPLSSLGQFTFDYTFNSVELAPNVNLSGSASLTVTPNVDVQVAFPFDLQSFSASVDADMMASVDVFVGASLSDDEKILLAQYRGAPFVVLAGPVPIVVVPTLNLYGGVEATADAGVDFNATMNGSYTAGAAWQKTAGWQNLGASSLQYSTTLANPTMGGSVRGYLRPEITLAVYGLSGPDIYGEGGITLAGSVNSAKHQFCWSLTGDLAGGVGIDLLTIGSVDLSYQAQVLSFTHQFAGTCYSTSSGSAPRVTTGAASAISSDSATLNGTVNPNGLATTIHFEWGTSASYGNSTTPQSIGSGTANVNVSANLLGLTPNTTYHFRVVASNTDGTANGTDHSYTTQTSGLGSLQVTISPSGAISAGAQWQVDGSAWQNSGATVSGLSVGDHTVAFNTVSGWVTPADQSVSIANGATTAATGAYTPVTTSGSLQVTISPPGVVSAGAQWQVDGSAWQNSGATVSGLNVGTHSVAFNTVNGWTTPASQLVSISANQTTSATGTYVSVSTGSGPQITTVQFSGSPGNYTVTVTGTGFGTLSTSLPFNGDTLYFRMADAAQLGAGEWGYTGDGNTISYQSWSDTQIQVSGFGGQPGDAVAMAVWNPSSGAGATWGGNVPGVSGIPQITSVIFSNSGQNLQIIVNGSGFGGAPQTMPLNGDLNYFSLGDFGTHCGSGSALFGAGFEGWGIVASNSVALNYESWSDSQIVVDGFAGSYGQGCATLQTGDPVIINVWNTSDTDDTGLQTAWGGFVTVGIQDGIGLLAYYPFTSGNPSDTVDGCAGTAINATPTSDLGGVSNNAYFFNGTNAYISLSSACLSSGISTGTLAAWVRLDSYEPSFGSVIFNRGIPAVSTSLQFQIHPDGHLLADLDDDNAPESIGQIQTGQWTHVAMTWDGTQLTYFINGTPSGVFAFTGTVQDNPAHSATRTVEIGVDDQFVGWFDGAIDELRIYNRALSSDDVQQLYHINSVLIGANWTEATSAAQWTNRQFHAAVVFNGQMWVLGGNNSNTYFNDVWSSSDGTNWTQVTPAAPWSPRTGHRAVEFNGQMWVLGGQQQNGSWTNDVWSSSDGTNWTQVTPAAPWSPRDLFGAVVFNGQMWVLGGTQRGDTPGFNDVWSSSDGTNWTQAPAAPWSGRYGFGAVVFNGQMWVLGGNQEQNMLNDVWSSSDGTIWTQAPAALWTNRQLQAAAVFNGQMWVLGGDAGFFNSSDLNDVWFSPDGTNWTEATPATQWSARRLHAAVVFNGQMWVLGGQAANQSFLNDVWASGTIE